LLYTAKGTASLLVPLSSMLTAMTGNWYAVFVVASVMNAVAALMAWFVLRPMRLAHIEATHREAPLSARVVQAG
jgi:MFS transporter, OFA family, oxalate/formate antiporter